VGSVVFRWVAAFIEEASLDIAIYHCSAGFDLSALRGVPFLPFQVQTVRRGGLLALTQRSREKKHAEKPEGFDARKS